MKYLDSEGIITKVIEESKKYIQFQPLITETSANTMSRDRKIGMKIDGAISDLEKFKEMQKDASTISLNDE